VSSLKKVEDGLATEQFWGVRAKGKCPLHVSCSIQRCSNISVCYLAYKALGSASTQLAINLLASSLKTEKHTRALRELVTNATVRDDGIREGLIYLLKHNHDLEEEGKKTGDDGAGLGYFTMAQIYNNLGRQRHPDDLHLLLQAAGVDVGNKALPFVSSDVGRSGIIRQGVFTGLGLHRSTEAFEHILSRVKPGLEHERVQPIAIASLATAAEWQDKMSKRKAAEAVAELVRDSQHRVRRAALMALVRLEAKEYTGVLANSLVTFAKQDVPALERALKKLRESGADGSAEKVKELVKTVEDLESRLKKLESKLQITEAKEKAEAAAAKEVKDAGSESKL
jgi:uncharacterized membrane protein